MKRLIACLALCVSLGTIRGQSLVTFSFGSSASPTTSAVTADNVLASAFTGSLGSPTTSSTSPGSLSAGGSGGSYFTASNFRTSDGNFFEFTLTPTAGHSITLSSVSFMYLSTSSGPTTSSLLSSVDGFTSSLASFTLTRAPGSPVAADWHLASSSATITFDTATTFRLSGINASSASGSFKIDDVTMNGSLSAVPEPSTYAAITGVAALAAAVVRRHRKTRNERLRPIGAVTSSER